MRPRWFFPLPKGWLLDARQYAPKLDHQQATLLTLAAQSRPDHRCVMRARTPDLFDRDHNDLFDRDHNLATDFSIAIQGCLLL